MSCAHLRFTTNSLREIVSREKYKKARCSRLSHGQAGDQRWCYSFDIVPQFVIEREVPGAGTLSEIQIRNMSLLSLEALKDMGPQIQWLHSYVTEDKVYCVYLAPDEDSIREHARRAGLPADRIAAVRRLINPSELDY